MGVDVESVACAQDVSKEPPNFPSPMLDAGSPLDGPNAPAEKLQLQRSEPGAKPSQEPARQQPKSVPNSSPPAPGSAPQGGPSEAWEQQRQEADPQSSKKPAKPFKDDAISGRNQDDAISPGPSLEDTGDLGELGVDVEDDDDDDDDESVDDEEGEEEEPDDDDDDEDDDDDDEEPAGEETW